MHKHSTIYLSGLAWVVNRQSNHPDFVGILPILLENPESQPICDQDKKNPNFDICSDISSTPASTPMIP